VRDITEHLMEKTYEIHFTVLVSNWEESHVGGLAELGQAIKSEELM